MEYLKQVLHSKEIVDDKGHKHRLHSALRLDEADNIIELMKKTKARKTLEVGMAYGVSSMAFSIGHKDLGNNRGKHHWAIDPFQTTQWKSLGLYNVKQVGYDKHLTLIEEPSDIALPAMVHKHQGSFDVILIDGWHTFDATLVDAYYACKLLRTGGYLIIDDLWMPSIKQVLSYMSSNYKHLKLIHKGTSIVFQKVRDDSRSWDYHEKF